MLTSDNIIDLLTVMCNDKSYEVGGDASVSGVYWANSKPCSIEFRNMEGISLVPQQRLIVLSRERMISLLAELSVLRNAVEVISNTLGKSVEIEAINSRAYECLLKDLGIPTNS